MNTLSKAIVAASLAVTYGVASAAGAPGVERRTQAFLDALNNGGGTPIEQLAPADARKVLEGAQRSVQVALPKADVSDKVISVDGRQVKLKIVRPAGSKGVLPAFMFIHGGGWVLGDYPTHERLVRDLVDSSGAAAVFVDYTRSPEAGYGVALGEIYAATQWVAQHGKELQIDGHRLAVAGNSVGGNMAAALTLMAKDKGGPALRYQVLMWPVTDAGFDTASYKQYANGYFLTKNMMTWFWDSYTRDAAKRKEVYASPLQASLQQLKGLPPALIQTAEFDVLRDEGEAYGRKLDQAGVDVTVTRYNGMIHDFGLLNPLATVPGVRSQVLQAGAELKKHLAH